MNNPKVFRKTIRLPKELNNFLETCASEAGVSFSEFIRIICSDEKVNDIRKQSEKIFIQNSLSKKVNFLYNKNSNNLNQLAKSANIVNLTGKVSDEVYIKFLNQLRSITNEIKIINNLISLSRVDSNVD